MVRCILLPVCSSSLKLFERQNYTNPANKPSAARDHWHQKKQLPKGSCSYTQKNRCKVTGYGPQILRALCPCGCSCLLKTNITAPPEGKPAQYLSQEMTFLQIMLATSITVNPSTKRLSTYRYCSAGFVGVCSYN